MKKKPVVYVVAGPNGTGKTTFATQFLPKVADCRNFINADLIAKGLSPFNVDAAAMQAGRLFLGSIRENARKGADFGFETTLSGRGYVNLFKDLRRRGYRLNLYFLWIPGLSLALKRIADRVRLGGHAVPAVVVHRRFGKGLRNLFEIYMGLVDYCAIFDNSSAKPRLVFERSGGLDRVIKPETYDIIVKMSKEGR
ncbi:MAG TPA: zeta toxin family protein [bacterium]|nr:zeta toxin family protein [bacterium]